VLTLSDVTASEIFDDPRSVAVPRRAAEWGDYVQLLKPRVVSLVVFTGIAGLVCAPGEMNPILAVASVIAIAVGAGAAGALNMWFDADIDGAMRRTRTRPVPSGRVPATEALALGIVLSVLSVTLAALAGGLMAAGLLAFSIFFYAVVYTMWLKRRTAQNIVIGGLAGALPPAIAWAAKTGSLTIEPLILVAIIFIWTPPHFWALALYQSLDYSKVGVPMLPTVAGAKVTRAHVLGYSLLLAPLGMAPVATGMGGWLYMVVSALGGALFLLLALRVFQSRAGDGPDGDGSLYDGVREARPARDLFAFSILYLFALFAALIFERTLGLHALVPLPWLTGG
jgi:heme o synthase